ncbi:MULTISPECIES: isochorismatase family protein [unclassified Nocardioides]|uniref:isochorismatase family protein n=1 Tax=unclassified Nocardioides TaxID=2615069 RepID=UPI0009F1533F|nr:MULTISPECIES: isochorismatase family protein [unclassified Nocardioides]GAW50001.1 isochorismatase hydrolase [Nocardioides sp. PD653-B2]GAW55906.1 isochorismatase hydrolase [Nocardioides sp. PD653]
MPLTTLDPRTALVVVDLQHGVVTTPTAHPMGDVVARSAALAAAFRDRGLPVVLANVTGLAPGRTDAQQSGPSRPPRPPGWAELVAELAVSDADLLVTKQRWGAFIGTSLHERLQELGVTQVVLTGVATSAGVESTARSAYDHGYHVVLVTDAMTDRSAEAHDHSVERVFPRLGETTTTAEVLAGLRPAAP